MDAIFRQHRMDGLVPIWIDPNSGHLRGGTITLGARGDSYYEYLLKQWLLSDKADDKFRKEYETVRARRGGGVFGPALTCW
jgi:hypothetical protein